jgi:AraC-like DNA-binding protein
MVFTFPLLLGPRDVTRRLTSAGKEPLGVAASIAVPDGVAGASSAQPRRTRDPDQAELLVSQLFLPHRLDLSAEPDPIDMELAGLRLGNLTAGRLTYGRRVRVVAAEPARNFHINLPLRGRAVSRSGRADAVVTTPGQAMIFPPGAPGEVRGSADCAHLCLMLPRADVEAELEQLLGRSLDRQLTFDFHMDLSGQLGRLWRTSIQLVLGELANPTGMASAGRHVQGLLIDGLLLAQPHNYSDELQRQSAPAAGDAVRRAVEMMESRPGEPWTTGRLAGEVHLSVRALQEGFRRDHDMPPMTYLRGVRLRRAREELASSHPRTTTVRAVATRLGILHLSRFAAAYREEFGESATETLRRQRG